MSKYNPESPKVYGDRKGRLEVEIALTVPSKVALTIDTNSQKPQLFYFEEEDVFYGWSVNRGFFKIGEGGTGNIEGGVADTIYLSSQVIDGGGANL